VNGEKKGKTKEKKIRKKGERERGCPQGGRKSLHRTKDLISVEKKGRGGNAGSEKEKGCWGKDPPMGGGTAANINLFRLMLRGEVCQGRKGWEYDGEKRRCYCPIGGYPVGGKKGRGGGKKTGWQALPIHKLKKLKNRRGENAKNKKAALMWKCFSFLQEEQGGTEKRHPRSKWTLFWKKLSVWERKPAVNKKGKRGAGQGENRGGGKKKKSRGRCGGFGEPECVVVGEGEKKCVGEPLLVGGK